MTRTDAPTRRNFLKVGAVLAAPLAAAPAFASDGSQARLARLEDERAIRDLHQTWLRNAGTSGQRTSALLGAAIEENLHGVAAQPAGPPDEIRIDGKHATGRFHCMVELEMPIAKDCTLAQMAHLQGDGFVRRTESRVLRFDYVKTDGAWSIAKLTAASS